MVFSENSCRAQGAIEYLLIIGAAILVVAVVIMALTGALGFAKADSNTARTDYSDAVNDLNKLKKIN